MKQFRLFSSVTKCLQSIVPVYVRLLMKSMKLSNPLAFIGKKGSAHLQHLFFYHSKALYLSMSNRSFWREGHSEEIESTNSLHLFFPVLYSVNNLYFIYTKKISTSVHDDSRISYAVYAMSSGIHSCLVVEEAFDVLDSPCNYSPAFLQKTAQTSNTSNSTTKKTNRILVSPFHKCFKEKDETLWEQVTSAAFWDSNLLSNQHPNI